MAIVVTHENVPEQDAYDLFMYDENRGYYDDNGVWVSNRVPCATIPGPVFFALMNGDFEQVG